MKVLESSNAVLSNYEVYQHIVDCQAQDTKLERAQQMPNDVRKLLIQVRKSLENRPSPLAKQAETGAYNPDSIVLLFERLKQENFKSEFAKGEILGILNIRPSSTAVLSTVVEDMEERFTEDEQARIVEIIAEVLGHDDPSDEGLEADDADKEEDAERIDNADDGDATEAIAHKDTQKAI